MKRKLFNFAALLSLLLCVATVVLWVRSYCWLEEFEADRVGVVPVAHGRATVYSSNWIMGSNRGIIYWGIETSAVTYTPGIDDPEASEEIILNEWKAREGLHFRHSEQGAISAENIYGSTRHHFLGFYILFEGENPLRWPPGRANWALGVPAWALALFLLAIPAWKVSGIVRRRRAADEGSCRRCRYSLTGNTSGVCPECGTAVPPKPEVVA